MIDLASSDNLLLRLNAEAGYANNEVLISVAYSAMKGISSSLSFLCSNDFLLSEKRNYCCRYQSRKYCLVDLYTQSTDGRYRKALDSATSKIDLHWSRRSTLEGMFAFSTFTLTAVLFPAIVA